MNIIIKRFLNLTDMTRHSAQLRENVADDIVIITKKAEGRIGIAISENFLLSNFNAAYCNENDIEISLATNAKFGPYGNILSIPGATYTMLFPMAEDRVKYYEFIEVFTDIFSKIGNAEFVKNDFVIGDKKLMGCWFNPEKTQISAISSLGNVSKDIDNIYSDSFRENAGKIMPSDRVLGYNDIAKDKIDIVGMAQLMKEAFNRLTDIHIDKIIEVDGDIE